MRGSGEEGAPPGAGLDLSAVGGGTLAGLVWLTMLGVVQGMIGHGYPLTVSLETLGAALTQGVAAVMGGIWSARRAAGSGWLHGALTGLLFAGAIACVMGIKDAFPALSAFAQRAGAATALGALGGVIGVNMGGRR